jgi:signal transduction histidine kinase
MIRLSELRSWPARLLAFARFTEPREPRSGAALGLDAVLACVAAIASLTLASLTIEPHEHVPINALGWAALLALLITTVPLALRRAYPLAVFWVVLLGVVVDNQAANFVSFVAIVVAAYSAVVHSRFRGAAVLSVLFAGVVVTAVYPDTSVPQPGRFTALFILVPVVMVGNAMRRWRHQAGDSEERLRRAEAEHQAATIRALAAERSRIASELHDVVTHNVSVMVVQAGAARRILAGSPDDARAALLAVEASGRTAMVELQHLLGLLCPVEGMQPETSPWEADTAPLRPQPGLGRLQALVDRVTAAGLPVRLTVTGPPRALPPGLDLTAYRVVQEALTNAMKHAGPAAAVVTLDYREDAVVIDVSDDGGPGHGPGREPNPARTGAVAVTGSGRGLLGLSERLSLYGGEFDAGPRPAGGWRVTARLPDTPTPALS